MVYDNKDKDVGKWIGNKRHGMGTMVYEIDGESEGEWMDNRRVRRRTSCVTQ